MTKRAAQALVFGSSAAVLVLEILAGRLMAPYVGVSLETFTGIIGTMLAGIALGSAMGGKLADQRDPRGLLGPALVLGGLFSWASLPIVGVVGPLADGTAPAIVLLALLAFFAPAVALSAVSPMVAKIRVNDLTETGTVVGGLSAAGTSGALFGTFVTGFVLVAAVPTRPIIIALGLVLVAVGGALALTIGKADPSAPTANGPLALIALALLGLALVAPNRCQFESAYACGQVVTDPDDPSLKFLILDTLRHGAVDLDDPTHLEFRYTRLMGDVIDAMPPGPVNALHLGGGGFTVPRYVEATRPGSDNLVLEIDPVLLDVARRDLGFVTTSSLRVEIGDARLALDDLETDSLDLIVGDAFGGLAVPWHLTTSEFVSELDRTLRPGGVYVMNLIDGNESRFARAELATLAEHFDHVAVVHPPDGTTTKAVNQILVASDAPLAVPNFDPENGVLLDDVAQFIGSAQILTDDFAPVDQLATNL